MPTRPRTPAPPGPRNGFTLVEVIVALVLMSVGALAALRLLTAVGQLAAGSRQITRSAELAAGRIETVRERLGRSGGCFTDGGLVAWGGLAERWAATPTDEGSTVAVMVETSYRRDGRLWADTVGTELPCP